MYVHVCVDMDIGVPVNAVCMWGGRDVDLAVHVGLGVELWMWVWV